MEEYPLPLANCALGVVGNFPLTNQRSVIESSIAYTSENEHAPYNISLDGSLQDNFADFQIAESKGLIDLSDLTLELGGKVTAEDGKPLGDDHNVVLANNGLHSFIKSITLFMNGTQVEVQPNYNYNSYLKNITNFDKSDIPTKGTLFGLRLPEFNPKEFTDETFEGMHNDLKKEMKRIKEHGFHFKGPLQLDVASAPSYLINNVPLRIRIELNEHGNILGSPNLKPKVKIEKMKLYTRVLYMRPNADLALQKSIANKPLVYHFTKFHTKNYILPAQQKVLYCENPFLSHVPSKIYIVLMDHQSYASSSYKLNPYRFDHCKLQRVTITLNDNIKYDISCNFPHDYTNIYYDTLKSLGGGTHHLLKRKYFDHGSTILVFNMENEILENGIHLNKSGTLRIQITLAEPPPNNISCYMMGESQSYFQISHDRRVTLHSPL